MMIAMGVTTVPMILDGVRSTCGSWRMKKTQRRTISTKAMNTSTTPMQINVICERRPESRGTSAGKTRRPRDASVS